MTFHPDPHPADDDLARYLDRRLDASARAAMEAHLIECDQCRQVVNEAAGLATRVWPSRRGPILAIGGLAAAALALVVVSRTAPVLPESERGSAPLLTEDAPRFSVIAPASDAVVEPDSLRFSWESSPPGTTFQLVVSDDRGVVVWNHRTSDSTVTLPATVTAALVRGQTYYWRVEALRPDLTTASTRVSTFIVSQP